MIHLPCGNLRRGPSRYMFLLLQVSVGGFAHGHPPFWSHRQNRIPRFWSITDHASEQFLCFPPDISAVRTLSMSVLPSARAPALHGAGSGSGSDRVPMFLPSGFPSSKYCLHTRDKFHHAEWLGDIIVRTEIQTFYLIKLRTFCGHHDHGNLPYFRHLPDLSQDCISVIPGSMMSSRIRSGIRLPSSSNSCSPFSSPFASNPVECRVYTSSSRIFLSSSTQ